MNELQYESSDVTPADEDPAPWRPFMMLVFVVLSFLVGMGTYAAYIAVRYQQWPGGNDFGFILCFGLMCYAAVAAPLWTGVLALARVELSYRNVPDHWRLAVYLALPPLVAIVPAAGIPIVFGGTPRAVLSLEGLALLVMFVAAGATYGAGWHICYGARRWTRENERSPDI